MDMKYAVISDIHGNLPAFEAVLADAKNQGVDKFLLIGDYASSFPWGNSVMDIIRNLPNAVVIKGNGEDYFIDIFSRKQLDFSNKQFTPVYWAYNSLSPENLEYVMSLPQTAVINDGGVDIYLNHALNVFYRYPNVKLFHPLNLRRAIEGAQFPISQYNCRATEAILACDGAVADMEALPMAVHLFGHNHMQFNMEYKGRMFVNPGSCGEPLDINTDASYTILNCANGRCLTQQRRVAYDLEETAKKLRESPYTKCAPEWSRVMELELYSAKDYFFEFVMHISETAKAMGETVHPISNEAFDAAAKTWMKL